jgi:hypothetical protein
MLPLMQDIAANTDKAIATVNADRHHLWASPFESETAKIHADAKQAKELLDGQLKLASVREQEQMLVSKVETSR